jgi:hypothetical protein
MSLFDHYFSVDVVTRCHGALLARAINDPTGHHVADKILMSLIMHTKACSDKLDAIENLRVALDGNDIFIRGMQQLKI